MKGKVLFFISMFLLLILYFADSSNAYSRNHFSRSNVGRRRCRQVRFEETKSDTTQMKFHNAKVAMQRGFLC